MRSLSELVKSILERNLLFEIALEGKEFSRKTASEVLTRYDSLESYFKEIADRHKTNILGVNLYSKNGSSFLRRGFFLVQIPAVDSPLITVDRAVDKNNRAVDDAGFTVDGSQINPAYSVNAADTAVDSPLITVDRAVDTAVERAVDSPLMGVHHPHETPVNTAPCPVHGKNPNIMDPISEILRFRLEHAEIKAAELERRNKELERKNDELYDENRALKSETLTQREKLELEFQKKEFDLIRDQKQGLNGVMETVSSLPPEAWSLIAGFLNRGSVQAQPTGQLEGAGPSKKHADPDANICIDMLVDVLVTQPVENVGMIVSVVENLLTSPEVLKQAYIQFSNNANPQMQVI